MARASRAIQYAARVARDCYYSEPMPTATIRSALVSFVALLFVATFGACVGDTPVIDSNANDSGGADTSSTLPDGAKAACTSANSTCSGNMLHACRLDQSGFDDSTCTTSCVTTPSAHCTAIVPSANGVVATDLDGTGLSTIAIIANGTINSDTGEITGVRTANMNASTREVISGIA